MKEKKITLFGVEFEENNPNLKINRDNYAIIDKKNHEVSATLRRNAYMKEFLESDIEKIHNVGKKYFDSLYKIFEDDTFSTFTDEYCLAHKNDCLYNYDLNMKFFEKLNEDEFNKTVNKVLKKFKNLYEIFDINDVSGITGVYIMILDKYKQMYVGQASDLYKRIRQHWTRKNDFWRLIFGSVEDSVLSIDSFGPLDVSRIFVYKCTDKEKAEEKIVSYIPNDFLLNRTRGGDRGSDEVNMKLDTVAHRNKRKLV